MENIWLKEKVREELEVEYKQKLDEVVALYQKKLDDTYEECYQYVLAERARTKQAEDELFKAEKKLSAYEPAEINIAAKSKDVAEGSRTLNSVWSKDGEDKPPYSILIARDKHA